MDQPDVQTIVQQAIDEYVKRDAALLEERRRREQLEKRINEMSEENKRSRQIAEEAQRSTAIRAELQKLGVVKVDLAYKVVQDGIVRTEDGRVMARGDNGDQSLTEFLSGFVNENPEFLPARIAGGTGMTGMQKAAPVSAGAVDLDKIGPSMSREELERARQEILRVASQTLR